MREYFLEVIRPGINTTFQDKGRFHKQHLGVTPGGCMDLASFLIANVYGEPEKINTYMWARMSKDLNLGTWTQGSVGDM